MENISVAGEFGRKPALSFNGTPSDELVVEVLHAGDGQVVEAGDTITCHYYGAVFGSDVDFDNSFDRGGALSFQIGVGMVIPGWDEGLVGKRVGDRVLLSIPAELGYGARGVPQAGIRCKNQGTEEEPLQPHGAERAGQGAICRRFLRAGAGAGGHGRP